jgi:hypothetical protein
MQNHLNKCEKSREQEVAFMDFTRGVKRQGFTLDDDILRQRRRPPDSMPLVRAPNIVISVF